MAEETKTVTVVAPPTAAAASPKSAQAFDFGRFGRRLAAIPSATIALNTLIRTYGGTLTARSRYLCTNNPYAVSAKEAFVTSLVGYGIKPSTLDETPANKKTIQKLWLDWIKEADYDGRADFYGMQALIAAELFEAGECFLILSNPGRTMKTGIPLQLRLIPAEMCPYEMNMTAAPGNFIQMGVEFNQGGQRVAYHFLRSHPGDITTDPARNYGYERVDAANVLHLFQPIRVGQVRGVPHTVSALLTLAGLDLYDDAELERKRVAALFAAFVTRKDDAGDEDHPLGAPTNPVNEDGTPRGYGSAANGGQVKEEWSMQPGAVVDLEPGEDIKFSAPADLGNQYENFQYRQLMRVAAGFGVPYASMTGDLRRANYGSIRAGLVEFKRRITAKQNQVMTFQLNDPVWSRWSALGAYAGKMPFSYAEYLADQLDHDRVKWIPPFWDWVDPLKDQQAEKLAVDNGFKARADVIEEQGNDPEENDARMKDDQDRAKKLGLLLDTGVGTARLQVPAPDDANNDDNAATNPDGSTEEPSEQGTEEGTEQNG